MRSEEPGLEAVEVVKGAARCTWQAVRRIAANDVLLASLALAALIIFFFYDVTFLGRTLLVSPYAYERQGVTATSPPSGYPGEDPPNYNYYLIDPLPSSRFYEPHVEKAARLYRDFEVPLWDANIALGRPFLANDDPGVVSPLRSSLILFPSAEMADAFMLARLLVAGLFTYLLAKRLGLAKLAAFGAAVAFALSGYFMMFMNLQPNADFAMVIPMLLYAFDLLLERPGPGRTALAAAATGLGILAGNAETAVLLLLYAVAYYLGRAFEQSRREGGAALMPRLFALGPAVGIGVGLTAFVFIPFLELTGSLGFAGLSVHLHNPGSGFFLQFSQLRTLIFLVVPYLEGAPRQAFNPANFAEWTGIRHYTGGVVLLLGFVALWNRPAMARGGWFFLVAALVLTAKWFGVPAVNWVGRLPILEVIDPTQYLPALVAFSLAMLAGIGLDQVSRARLRWMHLAAAVPLFALLLGWLVWLNRGILGDIPTSILVLHLGAALGLATLAVAVLVATRGRWLPVHSASALLIALVTTELFLPTLPVRGDFGFITQDVYARALPIVERPIRYDPFDSEPPFIRFLKSDTSKYRVLGNSHVATPNMLSALDIDDLRGYTNPTVERYLIYIRNFVSPQTGFRFDARGWPPLDRQGGPSLLAGNPMLDLLNIKYFMTPSYLPLAYDYRLAERFLPTEPAEDTTIRLDVFTINGKDEVVLFQHPASSLSHTFTPSEESRFFLFKLGLDPEVWRPEFGDGVLFELSLQEEGGGETLFSRWVDPKNDPEDRRWIDGVVDLSPYLGQQITLALTTAPGASAANDLAGWGALRLAPSPDTPPDRSSSSQFRLAFDGDVKVYENRDALPRAFVVHQAAVVSEVGQAVARMKEEGFNPAQTAVIEGTPPQEQLVFLEASSAMDSSSAEITSYSDNQVKLLARMENPGLLVLSDTYYPGWKAYVDGKETPIYPTDVALRSVYLEPGEHEVRFEYSPGSFKLGVLISGLSLLALAILAGWGVARSLRTRLRDRRGSDQARGGASG